MRQDAVYAPPPGPVRIVHEDDALLVLDKPSGLLTVPGKGPDLADCLESRARHARPGCRIVHRLDRDTSGLVVMARTHAACGALGRQFEGRSVAKTYVAVVEGRLAQDTGEIDAPLMADWPNRPRQMIAPEGKPSLTKWAVIARIQETTRLRLTPVTGRSHQLRVHLDSIGHPILGDNLYGTTKSRTAAPRLMLHAQSLSLTHPDTGTRLTFTADPPF